MWKKWWFNKNDLNGGGRCGFRDQADKITFEKLWGLFVTLAACIGLAFSMVFLLAFTRWLKKRPIITELIGNVERQVLGPVMYEI